MGKPTMFKVVSTNIVETVHKVEYFNVLFNL